MADNKSVEIDGDVDNEGVDDSIFAQVAEANGYNDPVEEVVDLGEDAVDDLNPDFFEGEEAEPEVPDNINFSPELLRAAGLTQEEASQSFNDDAELAQAIRFLDSTFIQNGSKEIQQSYINQPKDLVAPEEFPTFELPKPKNSEDWDEDTRSLINSVVEHNKKVLDANNKLIQDQKAQIEALRGQREEDKRKQYIDHFDSLISALPPKWGKLFGQGSGYNLDPKGLYLRNRVQLDNTMQAMRIGMQQNGVPIPSDPELMVRALYATFPRVVEETIEADTATKMEVAKNRQTARPSRRETKAVNSDVQAYRTAEDWYLRHGITPGDTESEMAY